MKIYISYILGLVLMLQSCRDKDQFTFKESPSHRTQATINALRTDLVSATHGWLITYFPETDSLKFSDPVKNIKTSDYSVIFIDKKFGKGGYQFYAKFNNNGTVEMLSDYNYDSATNLKTSDFEIKQNTYTELSFVTYNYIHQLLKSDFLFWKKDSQGRLFFRTNNYIEQGKEYIVLSKREVAHPTPKEQMYQTFYQKLSFEQLNNPKLVIKNKAGDIEYESNIQTRKISPENRYTVFIKNWQPTLYKSSYYSALGSGYMPTENGLLFYPGIKLKDGVVFRNFIKNGNAYYASVEGYTAEIINS
ncbi:DUF4302 domain-containing protein [Riemerella columbina]|uniref:DUF4302 domain-containing protein n=1 Tax=Riemerella columbina TaxID=103810 RepID=UPI00266F73EC|nr:DUF4302 domain-containing protein [Riemerella columbina]WKS95686.1 DUF4302 domain-containing protein [Riemerella columbina]